MVVSTVIFSFFVVAYADRMLIHDWKSMPEPWLLWANTCVLMITSYFFHKTKIASDRSENEKVKNGLFTVGFLSFIFIIGQLLAWHQLLNLGYFASSNVANAFFYLLTTLHGLHLLGGLIFWGLATSKFLNETIEYQECNEPLSSVLFIGIFYLLFGLCCLG